MNSHACSLVVLALTLALPVVAQDSAPAAPFTQDQLEQMVAPIALYPDALVAQMLMASTWSGAITTRAPTFVRSNKRSAKR